MKRNLVKEYRIRKFRKLYENFDDDLDAMSDEILKNDPHVDFDDDLDSRVKDIIDKEPGYFYHGDEYGDNPKTFNTIDEWLDDKVIETALNPGFYFDGNVVKRLTGTLKTITHLLDGLDTVRYLKKKIKEISNMNVLVAQQKLVNALRKRIKEEGPKQVELINKHKKQFNNFAEDLKKYLEEDIRKCAGKKSYYVTYTISPKDDFSAEFVVRNKYYKDHTVSFNVAECRHVAWNKDHFYNVKMNRTWPSEKQNVNNEELTEKETKNYISSKVCWKLNGYEFDEGQFYPYDPNF